MTQYSRLSLCLALISAITPPAIANPPAASPPANSVSQPTEPPSNPIADPASIVNVGNARFTVMTPALIRMEWAADGKFEDRASFAFINRRLSVPAFESERDGEWTIIRTTELTLRYRANGGRFDKDNLTIELKCAGKPVTWRPGTPDTGNLRGTTRTLDGVSGSCELEPGILSRDGWAIVDDSARLLFDSGDRPWVATRAEGDRLDWYFFGYGHDYKRALLDFTLVAGKIPLPPRWVFGAWWSRYWAYSDEELRQLVKEFNDHQVPLDVLVIDMDWHLDGWTGYTWNPKYFPDPKGFLDWAHEQGLKVTLNLHPADGVGKHEAAFAEVCRDMGLDPSKTENVPFDCADRKYMDAYFKRLHHPLEQMGIDFWWLDWQQGTQTKVAGLDPLFWLNHLHWHDMAKNPDRGCKLASDQSSATAVSAVQKPSDASNSGKPTPSSQPSSDESSLASARGSSTTSTPVNTEESSRLRPLIFSRWGGLGNHRYPIGFSGDTYCNWQSLAFQPYFTATAGNVGYAYWSHDIGGHQPGKVDPELYVRWIQWGALSPVLRTHTSKNPDAERRIWEFPEQYFLAAREAYRLRYQLLPYIYTMAKKTYDTGIPLCRPLYYEWPELDEAYARTGQYMFGDDLLVAPVTEPGDPGTGCANIEVWIPPGKWTNWFTGYTYTGPSIARLLVPIGDIPLFVRNGAIIPMAPTPQPANPKSPGFLALNCFPSQFGETAVYYDDTRTEDYRLNQSGMLPISYQADDSALTVTIAPLSTHWRHAPTSERFVVKQWGAAFSPRSLSMNNGDSLPPSDAEKEFHYDDLVLSASGKFGPNFLFPLASLSERNVLHIREEKTNPSKLISPIDFPSGFRGLVRTMSGLPGASNKDAKGSLITSVDSDLYVSWYLCASVEDSHLPQKLAQDWFEYVATGTLPLGADMDNTARIIALGIYHDFRFSVTDAGANRITCDLTLSPVHQVVSYNDVSASILFESHPELIWKSNRELRLKDMSSATTATVDFKTDNPLASTILKARVRLARGTLTGTTKSQTDIWFQQTLFPSINHWLLLGPFDASFDKGLSTKFPPEMDPGKVDTTAVYDGKGGKKIAWRHMSRSIKPGDDVTAENFVDLNAIYGSPTDAVAYGLTYLQAPNDMDASLAFGTDDGAALWLNGKETYRQDVGRAYTSKLDRVQVKLKKGSNPLLIKVKQGTGGWGFCVHVETPDGKPLPSVTAQLEPAIDPR